MPKTDYSEYEKRRAADHEFEWRLTATLNLIQNHFCRFRECRRNRQCCGPMVRSAHQDGQVKAQREIGLSGDACACLPRCVAQANAPQYAALHQSMKQVREMRSKVGNDQAMAARFRRRQEPRARHKPPHQGSNG
ncbi:hypothetical protein [Neorhizobium alkalisoli]|uniref:hypothetical protein n=1 Tax=Neorhizobium alkalisoli TaxID=528178 RepID=UPI00119E1A3C|nr:hypothetical protein [Neorhizobium alkalisoli]